MTSIGASFYEGGGVGGQKIFLMFPSKAPLGLKSFFANSGKFWYMLAYFAKKQTHPSSWMQMYNNRHFEAYSRNLLL